MATPKSMPSLRRTELKRRAPCSNNRRIGAEFWKKQGILWTNVWHLMVPVWFVFPLRLSRFNLQVSSWCGDHTIRTIGILLLLHHGCYWILVEYRTCTLTLCEQDQTEVGWVITGYNSNNVIDTAGHKLQSTVARCNQKQWLTYGRLRRCSEWWGSTHPHKAWKILKEKTSNGYQRLMAQTSCVPKQYIYIHRSTKA